MLFGSFVVAACSRSKTISGIHMSNEERVDVPFGNFSYEGVKVTVDYVGGDHTEINLEENMIPEIERLKFYKIGEQDVKVTFRDKFNTIMKINVALNKFNDIYALNGYECVYDGLPHQVALNHELPEGATITYPRGNTFTNAGTYQIIGVIEKYGYESKTLQATLNILPAQRDASGIVFQDKTVTYDGEQQTIEATGVPEGIEVTYDAYNYTTGTRINRVVSAGTYKIVAHFNDANSNYEKIPDKEAILTIEKATYDLSTIKVPDHVKEYDGEDYTPVLMNKDKLPRGVSVTFKILNKDGIEVITNANVGVYTIVAHFDDYDKNNYNEIEDMTGTLTVTKRVIKVENVVVFNSASFTFDEDAHSIEVTNLPAGVTVEYENNGQVYAGEYAVKAKFSAINDYETVDVSEISAYLIITRTEDRRTVKVYNDATQEYDKDFSSENISIVDGKAVVSGFDDSVFVVDVINFSNLEDGTLVKVENFVDGTTYAYTVTFSYIDERMNYSVILAACTGEFTYHAA